MGEIKSKARERLSGNFLNILIILVIIYIIGWVFERIPGWCGVKMSVTHTLFWKITYTTPTTFGSVWKWLTVVLKSILSIASAHFALNVIRNKENSIADSFKAPLKNIFTIIIVSIIVDILTTIGCIILIIPGIIIALGFAMAKFVMIDHPDKGILDVLKDSWEIMKGHKLDYFLFLLSFIGWWILCVVTLGLAQIYVTPYFTLACAAYYDHLAAKN